MRWGLLIGLLLPAVGNPEMKKPAVVTSQPRASIFHQIVDSYQPASFP
jgi:hypothetical protein